MCRQFEEVMAMGEARGEARGRARGRAEEKERSILSVLNNGVSEEETARLLNLAIEEVRQAAIRQKASGASL
jgi:predicted transposase YdaD